MFVGTYYYTLDEGKRISVPAPFRKEAKQWVVTRGLDGGLTVFKKEDFAQQLSQLETRAFNKKSVRDFLRIMANEAQEVTTDSQGRITLSDHLLQAAQLTKQAIITGSINYIEIWDQTQYHNYLDAIKTQGTGIAEQMELRHE